MIKEKKFMTNKKDVQEKIINPISGYLMMLITALIQVGATVALIIFATQASDDFDIWAGLIIACVAIIFLACILWPGFKIVAPNEAIVLLLFGKYHGTVSKAGFFWVNPFSRRAPVGLGGASSGLVRPLGFAFGRPKVSLKALTHNNEKQKVNDADGNPIEIGVVVIWRIVNTAQALFNVDNYTSYISTQSDSAVRHIARQYPYDYSGAGDEQSLRGSSQEIAEVLKKELQERANIAGIEIMDARISHLAYAPEIAQVMLQRQQANAIIAARQKIVDGAVSMVEMALNKIDENKIVKFDAEQKAKMVANLLVILCGNKDATPIINSGAL
jgi:regulator of protease activity HflC (stomatin/prohibitin superfamily)